MIVANDRPQKNGFDPGALKRFLASNLCVADYETVADDSLPGLTYFGGVQFGAIDVFSHEGNGLHRGYRRWHHIRMDRVDDFLISLPVRGQSTMLQMGTEVAFKPGSYIVSSTSKPFVESIASEQGSGLFQAYQVRVSGPLLRARVPRIDDYCHTPIRIDAGAGAIMSSLFAMALNEGRALSATQSRNFSNMLIDAVANATREAPELHELQPESRQSSYARVREVAEHFIECNISNPALDPVVIAEHCGVSVRYLYAAFASAAKTLGTVIRETRLERCRATLLSPEMRDRSVFEIALRWGFNDPAYFSRTYKSRFGKSPKADRDCA